MRAQINPILCFMQIHNYFTPQGVTNALSHLKGSWLYMTVECSHDTQYAQPPV
jgi:hypothetical protein